MEKRFKFLDWDRLSGDQGIQAKQLIAKNLPKRSYQEIRYVIDSLNPGCKGHIKAFCALDEGKVFSIIGGEPKFADGENRLILHFAISPLSKSKKDFVAQTKKSPIDRLTTLMFHWAANRGCTKIKFGTRLAGNETQAMYASRADKMRKKLEKAVESKKRLARRNVVRK